MKKFLAMVLAAMLLLSVGAVAVAENHTKELFTKKLDITNNGTEIVATEFSFTAAFSKYSDGTNEDSSVTGVDLTFGEVTLSSAADRQSGTVTLTHGDFPKVGIYTYDVSENDTNKAGIENHSGAMVLVITVMNGTNGFEYDYAFYPNGTSSAKGNEITNTYNAGELKVSKTVSGKLGNQKDLYFEFKVKLEGETDKNYAEGFAISGGTNTNNPETIKINEETTIYLKHDDTITIANVPYNVKYTVTEVDANKNGYETRVNSEDSADGVASGTINESTQTAAFENIKGSEYSPDTGITTDSLPYVMLLGFVLLAGAALLMKRRMAH